MRGLSCLTTSMLIVGLTAAPAHADTIEINRNKESLQNVEYWIRRT
jgi:hypothetical protein